MRHFGLFITSLLFCTIVLSGQNYGELQREYFGPGLYKVKSGDQYGIFDSKDNVVVSVEYENILLPPDGIAALRKKNGCVYGTITEKGTVSFFEKVYRYHTSYPFYSEGFLPVRNIKEKSKEKWFFVDSNGRQVLTKNVGGFIRPMSFSKVMPFNEGYASVVDKKGVPLHVDRTGQERFIVENERVLFRTSVKEGEVVIVTSTGVKLYQEDKSTYRAMVKRVISTSTIYKVVMNGPSETRLEFKDGTLYLDYLGVASKYVPKKGEPIVFGKVVVNKKSVSVNGNKSTKIIDPRKPVFNLQEDISVSLKQKVVSASSKGWAGVTIFLKNNSQISSGFLSVTVKSAGIKPKNELVEIQPAETSGIKISLPAQFSESQKKQDIVVEISAGDTIVEKRLSVMLKRYEASSIL